MTTGYITASGTITDQYETTATIYLPDAVPIRYSQTSSMVTSDDNSVKAVAEKHLHNHGFQLDSNWAIAPDPDNRSGQRRMVWIARITSIEDGIPCQRTGADPEAWFPVLSANGATLADMRQVEHDAERLCRQCPDQVKQACLDEGMRHDYGIWGGETEWQRRERRTLYLSVREASA